MNSFLKGLSIKQKNTHKSNLISQALEAAKTLKGDGTIKGAQALSNSTNHQLGVQNGISAQTAPSPTSNPKSAKSALDIQHLQRMNAIVSRVSSSSPELSIITSSNSLSLKHALKQSKPVEKSIDASVLNLPGSPLANQLKIQGAQLQKQKLLQSQIQHLPPDQQALILKAVQQNTLPILTSSQHKSVLEKNTKGVSNAETLLKSSLALSAERNNKNTLRNKIPAKSATATPSSSASLPPVKTEPEHPYAKNWLMALNADQTAYLNPSAHIPCKSHDDGIARLMRYKIAH
jgi:hypothetical protein